MKSIEARMKNASRFLSHIVATESRLRRFPSQDTNQINQKSPIWGDRERFIQPTVVRFITSRQVPSRVGIRAPIQSDASSVARVADAVSVDTVTERESAT